MLFSLITVAVSLPLTFAGAIKHRQSYPVDPATTTYCTWFYDNDGSADCASIPGTWGISLADFIRWVSEILSDCPSR